MFDDRHSFIDYIRELEYGHDITDRVLSLHNFIERVLKLNKTPRVDKFFLMMYSFLRDSDAIRSWLDWIVNKLQAKEIEIYFNRGACSARNKALSISCGREYFNLTRFLSLVRLQLCFLNYSSWDVLPKLLECAPNLEVLVISKDYKGKDSEFSKDSTWVQPSNVPACLLSSLRQVEVLDCESNQAEFELISYLLRHGETLSTFLVELLPANSRHDLRFRDDLMKIPMVSRTCELKISAYPHCSHRTSFSSEKDCSSTQLQRRMLPQKMCFDDLKLCTNYFSNENLLARTEDFKVYRGKLYESDADDSPAKNVVVKKWVIPAENPYNEHKEYAMLCFREELKLSKHPNFTCHPNFMSLLGYCVEDSNERLGMIYDFNPLDHLEKLIPKDSFTWLHRIKVTLILACIMEYMHKKHGDLPSVTPRISPSSVIIDENYMPVLFDFNRESGRFAKEDMYDYSIGKSFDRTMIDYDVENYGLTLFALISKRDHRCPNGKRHTSECETLDRWAMLEYAERYITSSLCKSEVPLVHRELMNDPKYDSADGLKLTRLTMRCLEKFQRLPSMQAIVKYLCKLRVVRENWDVIDHNNAISNYLNVQVS